MREPVAVRGVPRYGNIVCFPTAMRRLLLRVHLGLIALIALIALTACDGPQSALAPAGRDAEIIAEIFWWMLGGAAFLWAAVVGLAVYAIWVDRTAHDPRVGRVLIIGGGAVLPSVLLAVLLSWGLSSMSPLLALPPPGGMRIAVTGEQWWWRVRYLMPDGSEIELANEIRMPLGERIEFVLDSADVIHSFWVPALGGKMDMIPGRVTRLALEPTRTGVFRGACAEFCGSAHALMNFYVVVLEREAFDQWLAAERRVAVPAAEPDAVRGGEVFLASGCGSCHTVRGTAADGVIGPDLTHVGSRHSLAAGTLQNDLGAFRRFLADPEAIKPGAHMPGFGGMPSGELDALAAYLDGLR